MQKWIGHVARKEVSRSTFHLKALMGRDHLGGLGMHPLHADKDGFRRLSLSVLFTLKTKTRRKWGASSYNLWNIIEEKILRKYLRHWFWIDFYVESASPPFYDELVMS
jgi:hypothetical protein